jgi:WD40 repeat protein
MIPLRMPAALVVALFLGFPLPAAPPAAGVDLLGDALPPGAVARLGTLRQRSYCTYDVRFSPDGKTIQTISAHRALWCEWDAASGALLRTRRVVQDTPGIVEFTPDLGAYAVEAGKNRLRVADTFTARTIAERQLPPGTTPDARAFSPDGKWIALTGAKPVPRGQARTDRRFVVVWNFENDALRLLDDLPGQVNDVRFSADGKRLAVVSWVHPPGRDEFGEVSCWDLSTGNRLWQVEHPGAVFATSLFSPDGATLIVRLSVPGTGHRIEAWAADTGKPRPEWKPRDPPGARGNLELRGFSPDGRLLLYSDDRLHALNVRTGRNRFTLPVDDGPVVFAPDGKSFVTVHRLLRRWDAATGNPLWEDTADRGHDQPVDTLALSPDGKRLASKDENGLLVWDLNNHHPKTAVKGHWYGSLLFARDGRTLFAAAEVAHATGGVVGLDPEAGKEMVKLSTAGVFDAELGTRTRNIRLLPEGRVAAVADLWTDDYQQDTAAVAWDSKTGKVADKLVLPADLGFDAVLAADGRTVAGRDTLFDTRTKATRRLRLEAREDAEAGQFSPDGRFVAGVIHRRDPRQNHGPETVLGLGVWELASGRLVGRLPVKNWDGFRLLAGGQLLILHAYRLAVWDVAGGKEVLSRPVPKTDGPWAGSLAVSADGRLAATGHLLGTILLWDLGGKAPRTK